MLLITAEGNKGKSDTSVLSEVITTIDNERARSQRAKPSSRGRLLFALVFALSALYMAHELKRGWAPSKRRCRGL